MGKNNRRRWINKAAGILAYTIILLHIFPFVIYATPLNPGTPIKPGTPISPGDPIDPGPPILPGQETHPGDANKQDFSGGKGQSNPTENNQEGKSDTEVQTSPYLSDDSKLNDWKYYLGKVGGISFTSATSYLAYQNGHRLLQVIDGATGKTTNYLVTGTKKNALPANAPWHQRYITNPIHNFLTETGRNGKKVKDASVKKGLFGGKTEAKVLPVKNHYTNPLSTFKHGLSKAGGWLINGGIATYAAYQEHGFGNSDFAATAITETAFSVGAAAAGSAVGTMIAGAAIGLLLETKTGRRVKDWVRTGVKKGIEKGTTMVKSGWNKLKSFFNK